MVISMVYKSKMPMVSYGKPLQVSDTTFVSSTLFLAIAA